MNRGTLTASQSARPLKGHAAGQGKKGGGDGNRTRVQGFAGPCLSHSATPPQERASPTAKVPASPSGRRDSNPRPSPWQGDALPAEPRPHAARVPPAWPPDHSGAASEHYPILAQPPTRKDTSVKKSVPLVRSLRCRHSRRACKKPRSWPGAHRAGVAPIARRRCRGLRGVRPGFRGGSPGPLRGPGPGSGRGATVPCAAGHSARSRRLRSRSPRLRGRGRRSASGSHRSP